MNRWTIDLFDLRFLLLINNYKYHKNSFVLYLSNLVTLRLDFKIKLQEYHYCYQKSFNIKKKKGKILNNVESLLFTNISVLSEALIWKRRIVQIDR